MRKFFLITISFILLASLTGCMSDINTQGSEFKPYTIEQILDIDIAKAEVVRLSVTYEIDEESFSFEVKDIESEVDRNLIVDFIKENITTQIEASEKAGEFYGLIEIKSEDDIYIAIFEKASVINNAYYYQVPAGVNEEFQKLYDSMDYKAQKLE